MTDELRPDEATAAAPDTPNPGTDAPPDAEQLGLELEQARAQVASLKDELLRGRAELDNQRKRAERDLEAAHKYALERFIHELLPVKDSLDLGLKAAATATDVASLSEGMAMTIKMFDDFFEKLSIKQIHPEGERFDPEFHQAMTMEEAPHVAPGTVTRVMQSGYVLNQRLLRPALVVVAKAADA
ncbi:MAG: nucleotide exchange factor GrpE [Gammaproteobacteria bacterium]|nr:nucleotide exchange factor GrpE [Gammaproteobacteria bacterium]